MSMIRKAAVGAVVLGAGLASTAGVAMANTSHGHGSEGHGSSSCTNNVKAENLSKAGGVANVLGGAQTITPVNVCHILDGNKVLNHNSVSLLDGIF